MKKIVILLALLVLCGCGRTEVSKNSDGSTSISRGPGSAEILELTLSDGTKCAALVKTNGGSLTCNWK